MTSSISSADVSSAKPGDHRRRRDDLALLTFVLVFVLCNSAIGVSRRPLQRFVVLYWRSGRAIANRICRFSFYFPDRKAAAVSVSVASRRDRNSGGASDDLSRRLLRYRSISSLRQHLVLCDRRGSQRVRRHASSPLTGEKVASREVAAGTICFSTKSAMQPIRRPERQAPQML